VLLLPLAITSTNGMIRRLGAARWKVLHKLVYIAGVCGAIHYIWMVKADIRQPLVYMTIVVLLLGIRLWWWLQGRLSMVAPRAVGKVN
jgi:sulfoxide reductase heme-binding subunit YedZ